MMVKIIAWLLKRKSLSESDMMILSNAVMHSLGALPIRGTISVDKNLSILVNGKRLNAEQVIRLRTSASTVYNSEAYKLIRDQIKYLAVEHGFHKATTPLEQLWARASLWTSNEIETLLKVLSQDSTL